MPLSYSELEKFCNGLATRARSRGIACAITKGMVCAALEVAETTEECGLVCAPKSASKFLGILGEVTLGGLLPSYRGNLGPPLDARWFRGGWTSQFA